MITRLAIALAVSTSFFAVSSHAQTDGGQPFETETNTSDEFPLVTLTFKSWEAELPEEYGEEGPIPAKPLVKLDSLSAEQYAMLAAKYKPKVKAKHKEVVFADSTFAIKNKVINKTFPYKRSGETTTCDYMGFMPKLNLHVVMYTDMHNETSWVSLIDRKSGASFDAAQCSDYPATVLPSPKSAQMAMFSNSLYDSQGCLYVVRAGRDKLKENYVLINRLEVNVKGAIIHTMHWVNENEVVLELGPEGEKTERQYVRMTLLN